MFSSKKRECPYCRKDGGYLDIRKGYKYIKNIHKEKVILIKDKKKNLKKCCNSSLKKPEKIKLIGNCCMAILASGKNAGKQCTNKCKIGSYCGKHKNLHKDT